MKTDKEYPATHSMYTAWYVADEDGNVGLIDYNDNGPVPWETEQTSIEELVFGHSEGSGKFIQINLTTNQINDLIKEPCLPEEFEDDSFYEKVVEIDTSRREIFLEFLKSKDVYYENIDSSRNLYYIEMLDISELKELFKQKCILKIYNQKDFYVNDNDEFEESSPYYLFSQDYSSSPVECVCVPQEPVKLSQVPEALRRRIPRIPVKFSECKSFQIAEWTPCKYTMYDDDRIRVNGCLYSLLTLTNGEEAYVLSSIDEVDFYPYCSEKDKYHCERCAESCAFCVANAFTDTPTVMFIVSPYRDIDYKYNVVSDIIIQRCIMIPYIHRIPYPIGKWRTWVSDVKEKVTEEEVESLYLKCSKYLDDMFHRYNPQVVIADDSVLKILKKVYSFENGSIDVGWKKIPFFNEADIERNRADIESLATQPYLGEHFPLVISVEEMEQLKKAGKCCKSKH